MKKFSFKSYCWAIGTTSYRTDKFNMNIELQLKLIDQFWNMPENYNKRWDNRQCEYYNFLKENKFVKGEAKRPDKDAREKTSGLRDIGLVDDERRITPVGKELLRMTNVENFKSDNIFEIYGDSYIYLKQLLKTCNNVDGKIVRPFIVFLFVISKVKYLTYDEFTYLLPLCIDKETTIKVVDYILEYREKEVDYNNILISVLMDMNNYKNALDVMLNNDVTEELICNIGMNRKSAKYDKIYYSIYQELIDIKFNNKKDVTSLYEAVKKIRNNKVKVAWMKYLFKKSSHRRKSDLNLNDVFAVNNIREFNESFFKVMHLFKAKATLSDYFDLNRRYFKTSDIVIFQDSKVVLDTIPKCYFSIVAEDLFKIAFTEDENLTNNIELNEISNCLNISRVELYRKLSNTVGKNIDNVQSMRDFIKEERYERFDKLVNEKFTREKIIWLLECFEKRFDNEIRAAVTDNADIPTIFEYVLGISWYLISEMKGDVLEYMNLSLEADLLPKTHAGGGEADIVWQYDETTIYPEHTLLIEATLADGSNQRRMEMEPVSRHLGEYLLQNKDREAYCVFITTYLNTNVVSDFRCRKQMPYYSNDGENYITGMKIMPIQTSELKNLLKNNYTYGEVYKIFENAHQSNEYPKEWYENNIVKETNAIYGN